MEQYDDYRLILKKELDARCSQNNHYSLRAFARDLELSPSRLSEILNRKQGLSRKVAAKISKTLGFENEETEHFCDLVSINHARSVKEKQEARLRLLKKQSEAEELNTFQVKLDAFKIISDWYHIGILELMNMKGFKSDTRWLARKLAVTPIQVDLAIDRLIRVGLLKRENDGTLIAVENDGWIPGGVPSESIRKFHRQILEKAMGALGTQTVEQRYFQTHMIALDHSDIKKASKEIQDFQRRFCKTYQSKEKKDSIYCIAMQLFKIAEES